VGTTAYIAHPNYPNSSAEVDFPHLSSSLKSLGTQITQSLESAEILISINHSPSHLKHFRRFVKSKKMMVLVRLEPQATYPIQYIKRITDRYDLVLTPGSLRNETRRIMWPYFYQPNPLRPSNTAPSLKTLGTQLISSSSHEMWNSRPYLMTLIASNKVGPTRFNNYSLRRRAVEELSSRGLETFGEMWDWSFPLKIRERIKVAWGATKSGYFPNPFALAEGLVSTFPEVRGKVKDKHSIIQKSKYSLVIENDNFFASEKIIDALVNGSLPFFIGGNLEEIGLDRKMVRPVNGFDEVIETIESLTPAQIEEWRRSTHRLVASSEFIDSWSGDKVYQRIASIIIETFQSQPN
jgi:hypothetical protein